MSPSSHRSTEIARACRASAAVLLLIISATACSAAPAPPPTAAIDEDVDLIVEHNDHDKSLRAVLVLEGGEPVYERYIESGPDDYWDIRSVTKSVIGTLVGIAIDRGLIGDVEATLGELLPRWADDLTAETSEIPLSAVLTHTANFPDEDQADQVGIWSSTDPVAAALVDRARRGAGDGSFRYSDVGSHVLSAIVAEASGMTPLEFARESLFDPLGIPSEPALEQPTPIPDAQLDAELRAYAEADFAWPIDGQDIHLGGAFLKLRPQDLARLGQLYLDEGLWEGERVVSEAWIEEATTAHIETPGGLRRGYGYQWWVASNAGYYCAMGFGGTLIVVHPEQEVVVVVANQIDIDDASGRHAMGLGNAGYLAEMILDEFGGGE